jgi:nucleoside-diphosphate-sugar epimerase
VIVGGAVAEPGFRSPPPASVVTGASGWLGRNLVPLLAARGAPVRCLVRTPLEGSELEVGSPSVVTIAGDVRDPTDLDRLFEGARDATVFHAAAVIHPGSGTREFFDVNVGGTALVIDRARRAGARRIVHVSSNSPFGEDRDPDALLDEDAPYRPASGYGRSKMEAELLVVRAGRAGDVETVVVRAPWFYGPGQPRRQTRFLSMVRRGLFPLVGAGTNRRSLAYTPALAEGLLRAELSERAAGRAYWLADARPYPMGEIIQSVKSALAAEGLVVAPRQPRLPGAIGELAGAIDRALQRVGRYSQELHVLSEMNKTIACSVERARSELGYTPPSSLLPGMRESVRWCLERGEPL